MKRIGKIMLSLFGVAVLVMAFSLAVPRAAHAVVATLVEVANTSANPVPTMDVYQSASNIIELICPTSLPSQGDCIQETPFVSPFPPAFTVPAGQHFVITEIESTCTGGVPIQLIINYEVASAPLSIETNDFFIPCSGVTGEIVLTPGKPIPSGDTILANAAPPTLVGTILRGYLTPN
jgi:hypothetical protein